MAATHDATYADKIAAYDAGYTQGEIVARTGNSSDAYGPSKRHANAEWEWHEGYHDALCGIYARKRVCG